jgi:hypothetical protein
LEQLVGNSRELGWPFLVVVEHVEFEKGGHLLGIRRDGQVAHVVVEVLVMVFSK